MEIDNPILKKAIIGNETAQLAKMMESSPKRMRMKSKEAKEKKKTFINVVPMHDFSEINWSA